ncbi:MAG: hypothetical protein LBR11_04630 [Deltaproteobacteria bacterium]|jgi:hypothetical protein|nr:hypothetical protein [Deltaproteobacteria bacterium]
MSVYPNFSMIDRYSRAIGFEVKIATFPDRYLALALTLTLPLGNHRLNQSRENPQELVFRADRRLSSGVGWNF